MPFSEGDWVEWIDPPQNPKHREAVKDLIKKNGLGPFKIVRVRDAHLHPQGGQMIWFEIRGVSHTAHENGDRHNLLLRPSRVPKRCIQTETIDYSLDP